MFKKHSITSQMITYLMMTTLAIIFIGTAFHTYNSVSYERDSLIRQHRIESNLIADYLSVPMAFFDFQEVKKRADSVIKNKDIKQFIIYDEEKKVVISSHKTENLSFNKKTPKIEIVSNSILPWKFGTLKSLTHIKQHNEILGYIYIEMTTDTLSKYFINSITNSFIFFTILMFLVYIISRNMSKKILEPVLSLADIAQKVTQTKDYSIRVPHSHIHEMQILYNAFNELLKDTQFLTNNLEDRVKQRTLELEESLKTIEQAQAQLVESEKMAALGSLVSSLAHEVNTPLGNAVTGSSIVTLETNNLMHLMQDGNMKKSDLQNALVTLSKTSKALEVSLARAADLIRSFKRISIDQSVEQMQRFYLYDYIENIIITFENSLKRNSIAIKLEGDTTLQINSYPGVYAQIITNLIQNSIMHGFEEKVDDAKISITFIKDGENLILAYKDNGLGMSEEIKKIAFEPFTTTKRNQGGTGLGLSILYNLVTQKLKGTIQLTSKAREGVLFEITAPLALTT